MKKKIVAKINDKDVYEYTLENEFIELKILSLGGIIYSFVDKKTNTNVSLNYPFIENYLADNAYVGKIAGLTAGRIENAKYVIENKKYELEKNEGENNLHDNANLSNYVFDSKIIKDKLELVYKEKVKYTDKLINVEIAIQYYIKENKLYMETFGITDDNLFINITNHVYFKLDNNGAMDHKLSINADNVFLIKDNKIPSSIKTDVNETVFDLRKERKIKEILEEGLNKELKKTKGIDNPFLLNKTDELTLAATLYSEENNLELKVYTTEECVVCYTGNYLGDNKGFKDYEAVALEMQNHPNAINIDEKYATKRLKPYHSLNVYELMHR